MKELTIVVASKDTQHTIQACLEALVGQVQVDEVEILVVDASTDGSAESARRFDQVKLIQADPACLVPALWKAGIDQSVGQSVAFTTANFIPAHNWVAELRDLLTDGNHAAIGGVFEKRTPDALSQWAVYFLRYSAYLPARSPQTAPQLAADNAVYRRWIFEKYSGFIQDGFWEHPLNQRLIADGYSLFLSPALKVSMGYFSPPGEFFRQRFLHGRVFGADRARRVNALRRLIYILLSPLIPLILLMRITVNVLKGNAQLVKFILSLPWLLFYSVAWALGELSGYLFGSPTESNAETNRVHTQP
ncbi:MAG: glycosyltransferase [Anaerolineales bacterium]|nr:glycosyltransferase [Anaerolineales bacterium]